MITWGVLRRNLLKHFHFFFCPFMFLVSLLIRASRWESVSVRFKHSDIAIWATFNPFGREMIIRKSPERAFAQTYLIVCLKIGNFYSPNLGFGVRKYKDHFSFSFVLKMFVKLEMIGEIREASICIVLKMFGWYEICMCIRSCTSVSLVLLADVVVCLGQISPGCSNLALSSLTNEVLLHATNVVILSLC